MECLTDSVASMSCIKFLKYLDGTVLVMTLSYHKVFVIRNNTDRILMVDEMNLML